MQGRVHKGFQLQLLLSCDMPAQQFSMTQAYSIDVLLVVFCHGTAVGYIQHWVSLHCSEVSTHGQGLKTVD